MVKFAFLLAASLSLTVSVNLHADAHQHDTAHYHQQHAAHEHGAAQLNLVQDKNTLLLEMNLSGMDVLGFEHAPSSDEQKAAVKQAEALLANSAKLFVLSAAAECHAESAQAERMSMVSEEIHEHDQEHHDKHEAHEHEEHEEHEAHDKHDEFGEETHSEFKARYGFHCKQVGKLKQLEVKLFELFSSLKKMQVQVVTEKGQTAMQLTPQNTRIQFP